MYSSVKYYAENNFLPSIIVFKVSDIENIVRCGVARRKYLTQFPRSDYWMLALDSVFIAADQKLYAVGVLRKTNLLNFNMII